MCLARALVVGVAKIENAPNYRTLIRNDKRIQEKEAKKLHAAANVPLGPCGINQSINQSIRLLKPNCSLKEN